MPKKIVALSIDSLVLDAFDAVLAKNFVVNRSASIQEYMMDTIRRHPDIYNELHAKRTQSLLFAVKK